MYVEGKARIKYSDNAFLNPTAKFVRDLCVEFVKEVASKETSILDPTAATGIRGIRYYLETKSKDLTLLDINEKAAAIARKNLAFNKVKASLMNKSIQEFANTTDRRFDIIDLDPFGSIAPNLYDLLKVSRDGTYFTFSATDAAVLCGAHPKACLKIYDAKPLHNELCQETGLRILIGYAARIAAQFNFGIEVLFSLSYVHYMRVILRLRHGSERTLESLRNLGYVYYCNSCGHRYHERGALPTYPEQNCCKGASRKTIAVAGKMWLGNLHNREVAAELLQSLKKAGTEQSGLKKVGAISEELDIPLYYSIPKTTKMMGVPGLSPDIVLQSLRKKGFKATRTQFDFSGIKTDADIAEIKSIIKSAK